jgi:hypothetical protein
MAHADHPPVARQDRHVQSHRVGHRHTPHDSRGAALAVADSFASVLS